MELKLDEEDLGRIDQVLANFDDIAGDCGDEYRRPPFLTASGDLSHHLTRPPEIFATRQRRDRPDRRIVDTGSIWESQCGYARAIRSGRHIFISGTTATHGAGEVVAAGDVEAQTTYILDRIQAAIEALGGEIEDVVRTRIYMKDCSMWEMAARAHGRMFSAIRPANTLVEISNLVGDYEIEIEAEALLAEA